MEAISFSTTKGRTYSAGKPGSGKAVTLTPPTAAAHVYAFKGFFSSNCAAPAISIVWATEGCPAPAAKAATVPLPAEAQAEVRTADRQAGVLRCSSPVLRSAASRTGPHVHDKWSCDLRAAAEHACGCGVSDGARGASKAWRDACAAHPPTQGHAHTCIDPP